MSDADERARLKQAQTLIRELAAHLDWIGWGDSYERECSRDLRKQVNLWEEAQEDGDDRPR